MNKKVLLLIAVLLCGIGSEAVAQEKSKTWTLGLWVKLQAAPPLKAFVYKG